MVESNKVIGVIYPLHGSVIKFMFDKKRNIFVKFTAHEPTKKTEIKLKKGMQLYIYQSRFEKKIVGEGTIFKVEYLYVNEVLNKYKNNLMISKKKLKNYSKGREKKKMLVLILKDLKKYKTPLQVKPRITMTGQYLTLKNKKYVFDS